MGSINCAACCQTPDNPSEIDLKASIISSSFILQASQLSKNQNSETTAQTPVSKPFTQKFNQQAFKIQAFLKGCQDRSQYSFLKKRAKLSYFPKEDIEETLQKTKKVSIGLITKPQYTYRSGGKYTGEWLGGFRHGIGQMTWKDGSFYQGQWSYGYPFGEGTFTHCSGEAYTGKWKNPYIAISRTLLKSRKQSWLQGIEDGYVWLMLKDASLSVNQGKDLIQMEEQSIQRQFDDVKERIQEIRGKIMNLFAPQNLSGKEFFEESLQEAGDYVGEWVNGLRDGVGRNVWPNGDIYEGQWGQDMQNGWGQNIWSDGSKYIGYYLNNLKSGVGEYHWEDGTKFIGEWMDNEIHGIGHYLWEDGKWYLGRWSEGLMHGFGTLQLNSGKKYIGEWNKGKKNGKAISITPQGEKLSEIWEQGVLKSSEKLGIV